MLDKPDFCKDCPINHVTKGYVPLQRGATRQMIIGEAAGENEAEQGKPFVGGAGSWLNNLLLAAGLKRNDFNIINTIGCQPPGNVYPTDHKWHHTSREAARVAVEHCARHHLWPAIKEVDPIKIIALGDQALSATTPRNRIMVWRGSPLPLKGTSKTLVIPALHPAYLMRDAGMVSVTVNDLKKSLELPPENYNLYATKVDLDNFSSTIFAFDFEWDRFGTITLCGLSDSLYSASVTHWNQDFQDRYKRIFEQATDLIGHNIIGADTTYFDKLGWKINARLHDTMLKQHLVQPALKHGLAPVASYLLNKVFWKGKGKEEEDENGNLVDTKTQWKTWDQPDAISRELGGYGGCRTADEAFRLYNARDTDASFQVNFQLDHLLDKWKLTPIYWNVSLPIALISRDIGDHGIRIDNSKLTVIRKELGEQIESIESTLPDGLRPYTKAVTRQLPAPPGTFKPVESKCSGSRATPHETVLLAFRIPGEGVQCPTCGKHFKPRKLKEVKKIKVPSSELVRPWNSTAKVLAYAKSVGLKAIINRKKGTETADVNARKSWGRTHHEFRILDKLKDLITERNNFAKESMQTVDRLHFDLLVHGTREGRLSCRGRREGIDPNIQQQPASIRKIYIPDRPDYSFLELDYSGGENWLTAWLAQDTKRLERLGQKGYSEHLELAKAIFKLPSTTTKAEATNWDGKDLYDVAKHINHGSNYGMTHVKLQEYCEAQGLYFTEKECKGFIALGQELNPGTYEWQKETQARAKKDGYLRNCFGRMLWFNTRDIATKCLAFLPASTLADIILRAMIAHYPSRFEKEIVALNLKVVGEYYPEWRMSAQIHDSLLAQGPTATIREQVARTKAIMTQSWPELGGFSLNVDVKQGESNWGEMKSLLI